MRQAFRCFVAFSLIHCTTVAAGVVRVAKSKETGPVVVSESAAMFVGIRDFTHDVTLTSVKYAVDDAIDLAYAVSMGGQTRLVDPNRVMLTLSGAPQKPVSVRHLSELRAAGAMLRPATLSDILLDLERQSRAVGSKGLLILGFATHGTNDGGIQHLLAADSLLHHPRTSVTEVTIREMMSKMSVPRAVMFIDACRERLTSNSRNGERDPRSAAMLKVLGEIDGICGLSAARNGGYAYDDPERGNGVFTAAVVDALQCRALTSTDGYVTLDALATYVEEHVRRWIEVHRGGDGKGVTELHCEGRSRSMPLANCR